MNLLTLPLRIPLLPAEGIFRLGEAIENEVIRLAEIIQGEAERQLHDPARIRRELDEAQRKHDAGEITDDELAYIQDQLTQSLVQVPAAPSAAAPGNDGS